MKNSTLFKSFATIALFAVAGMSSFAQVITSLPTPKTIADTSSLADTVTINSVMPYLVYRDAVVRKSPLYNASGFKWTITGTGASLNVGSLTPVAIGGTGTYYTDTTVVATFTSLGNVTISTTERSNPKFSATAGCDGNQRDLSVLVIARPSIPTIADVDTAQGGCSAAGPFTVKFNFSTSTTKFPIYVGFTVNAYDISGASMGTPQSYYYKINSAAEVMNLTSDDLKAAAGGTFLPGRYVVTLGNMWDRISYNATNRTASDIVVDASALKAAILVLPAPSTGIIKHIKTL